MNFAEVKNVVREAGGVEFDCDGGHWWVWWLPRGMLRYVKDTVVFYEPITDKNTFRKIQVKTIEDLRKLLGR